jgi:SPP1 family predicted phage head-tail adaptor
MDAGGMDRRVTLSHRSVAATDSNGFRAETYPSSYATVWAQKLDIIGREYVAMKQLQSEVSTRFRLRYRSDVLVTDRLTMDGVAYDIHSVAEIGRKEGLEIMASVVS